MICNTKPAHHAAVRACRSRRQSGVGLIEVMVAVLVLSIGFLGVGALLAMSLSTNNSAMARSLATIDSYSILDAMRADLNNAKGGKYNTTVIGSNCPVAGGSLASTQLSTWCQRLAADLGPLPTTKGNVNCNALGQNNAIAGDCTVTIQFDDSRAGVGGSTTQTVITKAIL